MNSVCRLPLHLFPVRISPEHDCGRGAAEIADELEQAEDFNAAVHELVRRTYVEHKRVIFDGNGYSEEWLEEATRRGLPNITNSVDAVQAFLDDKVVELFGKHGVLSSIELQARAEIRYEAYIKQINIEAKTMLDMASKQIRPAVVKYAGEVAQAIIAMKAVGMDTTAQEELLQDINENLKLLHEKLKVLEEETERAGHCRRIIKHRHSSIATMYSKQ